MDPPLILDQTEARRGENVFSETDPPFLSIDINEDMFHLKLGHGRRFT